MKLVHFYRAHFLTVLALAYLTGIILSTWSGAADETLLAGAACTLLAILICRWRGSHVTGSLFCILIFLIAGLYHGQATSSLPRDSSHIYHLVSQPADAVITGRLKTMATFDGTMSRATIEVNSVRLSGEETHTSACGTILLTMRFPWPEKHRPGTHLAVRAVLKRPGRYKTPGSFDYPEYLAVNKIWVTGTVRSPSQITDIQESDKTPAGLSPTIENIRTDIGIFLDRSFPENEMNGLYRAILIGDRSALPKATYEDFKASGLAHILAISGLHLSILATFLFFTIHKLLTLSTHLTLHINTKKAAGLISIPILVGYSMIAGMNSPVLRACIMAVALLFALFTNRMATLSVLIAAAAMMLLTLDPQALFTASFQLSFGAVASISAVTPVIRNLLEPRPDNGSSPDRATSALQFLKRWTLAALATSTAAILGTLPILLFHFHRFPLFGPVANLFVEPAVCLWSLPLGFTSIPFIYLAPPVAEFLLHLGAAGLLFSCTITSVIQSVPLNSIWSGSPPAITIFLYYASFIPAAWYLKKRAAIAPVALLPGAFMVLLMLAPPVHFPDSRKSEEIAVSFLDVGQGSATFLEFSDNTSLLIDGGGSSFSATSVGEGVIGPFLWKKGIRNIDGLIVTHPDSDHYNGLPFLIKHFSPKFIWTSTLASHEPGYAKLLELSRRNKVTLHLAEKGDELKFGKSTVRCLANTLTDMSFPQGSNGGLVLQLEHEELTLLLPGDIHRETEERLIRDRLVTHNDIYLAAHHGSATSNSAPFLDTIAPKAIVVSSGTSKKKSFPARELIDYSERKKIPLYKTAEHGTITVNRIGEKSLVLLIKEWQDCRNPLKRRKMTMIPVQEIN